MATKKPCHGCGQAAWRNVDEVCSDCKDILRVGRAVKLKSGVGVEKGKMFRLTKDWPTIYAPTGDPDTTKNLKKAFEELARASLKPVLSGKKPYDKDVAELPPSGGLVTYFSTFDEAATVWTGTKRVVDAISKLDLSLRKALLVVHKDGERKGSDLLMQLASGKISISELTEATIEAGRIR